MTNNVDALFKPFSFKDLTLANRIAMAPMTREFSPGGIPNEDVAGYYGRRAAGGTGLIITEGTTINDPVATMGLDIPQIHGDKPLAGWENKATLGECWAPPHHARPHPVRLFLGEWLLKVGEGRGFQELFLGDLGNAPSSSFELAFLTY